LAYQREYTRRKRDSETPEEREARLAEHRRQNLKYRKN
jgi:hypothetical protein